MNKTSIIILGIIVLIVVIFAYLNYTECQCDFSSAPKCADDEEIASEKFRNNWYCIKSCGRPICVPKQ